MQIIFADYIKLCLKLRIGHLTQGYTTSEISRITKICRVVRNQKPTLDKFFTKLETSKIIEKSKITLKKWYLEFPSYLVRSSLLLTVWWFPGIIWFRSPTIEQEKFRIKCIKSFDSQPTAHLFCYYLIIYFLVINKMSRRYGFEKKIVHNFTVPLSESCDISITVNNSAPIIIFKG